MLFGWPITCNYTRIHIVGPNSWNHKLVCYDAWKSTTSRQTWYQLGLVHQPLTMCCSGDKSWVYNGWLKFKFWERPHACSLFIWYTDCLKLTSLIVQDKYEISWDNLYFRGTFIYCIQSDYPCQQLLHMSEITQHINIGDRWP